MVLIVNIGLFPALTFGIVCLLNLTNFFDESLKDGLIFMSVVPTSISSCVIFTQTAKGNEALAVMNSVLGNILGVFISPGLIILMIGKSLKLDLGAVLFFFLVNKQFNQSINNRHF